MTTTAVAAAYRHAGVHERTGYPLLDVPDEEIAVRALAGLASRPSCGDCWWNKGNRAGAPFADGERSDWMDARCDYRYVELMDGEYERHDIFERGPYRRDHRTPGLCGSPTSIEKRWIERWGRESREVVPLNPGLCQRWWTDHYPRLNGDGADPACVHWRDRAPEMRRIAEGGHGADTATIWAELDAR